MVGLPTLAGINPGTVLQGSQLGASQGQALGANIADAIEAMSPEAKAKKALENRIIQARLDQMDAEKERNAYDISIRKTPEELTAEKKFNESKRNQELELGKVTLEDLNTRIKRFAEGIGVRHDAGGTILPAYQEKLRLSGMTPEQIQREAEKFVLDGMNHQLDVKEAQDRLDVMMPSKAIQTLSSASLFTPQDQSGNPTPFLSLNPSAEIPSSSVLSQAPLDRVNSLMSSESPDLKSVPKMIRTVQSGGKLVPNPEYLRLKKENDDLDEIGRKKGIPLFGKSLAEKYAIVKDLETKKTGEPKLDAGEVSFLGNSTELASQLNKFENTINEYGNFEVLNSEGSAALQNLPYETAILYSKMVDPATAAREGEVAAFQKYGIPVGMTTRNATTLSAIREQRKEIVRRIQSHAAITGQIPPNLPNNVLAMINRKGLGKGAEEFDRMYGSGELDLTNVPPEKRTKEFLPNVTTAEDYEKIMVGEMYWNTDMNQPFKKEESLYGGLPTYSVITDKK